MSNPIQHGKFIIRVIEEGGDRTYVEEVKREEEDEDGYSDFYAHRTPEIKKAKPYDNYEPAEQDREETEFTFNLPCELLKSWEGMLVIVGG